MARHLRLGNDRWTSESCDKPQRGTKCAAAEGPAHIFSRQWFELMQGVTWLSSEHSRVMSSWWRHELLMMNDALTAKFLNHIVLSDEKLPILFLPNVHRGWTLHRHFDSMGPPDLLVNDHRSAFATWALKSKVEGRILRNKKRCHFYSEACPLLGSQALISRLWVYFPSSTLSSSSYSEGTKPLLWTGTDTTPF